MDFPIPSSHGPASSSDLPNTFRPCKAARQCKLLTVQLALSRSAATRPIERDAIYRRRRSERGASNAWWRQEAGERALTVYRFWYKL